MEELVLIIGICFCFFGFGVLFGAFVLRKDEPIEVSPNRIIKRNPRKIIHANYKDEVMQVLYSDDTRDEFIGSGTVWRKSPMMERCSTDLENELCGIWKYIHKWKGDYPNAHKIY